MQIEIDENNSMYDGNLFTIAAEINKRKIEVPILESDEQEEERVSLTKKALEYLFYINQIKLVNLLSYDGYMLFFGSDEMVKADTSRPNELIDLKVDRSPEKPETFICGGVTKYHSDSSSTSPLAVKKYEYYGSLCVNYSYNSKRMTKYYTFSRTKGENGNELDSLTLTLIKDGRKYKKEVVLRNNCKLFYTVYLVEKDLNGKIETKPIISASEDDIVSAIDDYKGKEDIDLVDADNLVFLFPEIYEEKYFRSEGSSTRGRRGIIVNN